MNIGFYDERAATIQSRLKRKANKGLYLGGLRKGLHRRSQHHLLTLPLSFIAVSTVFGFFAGLFI